MSGYIEIEFDGDVSTLTAEAFDYLVNNIAGWVPQEGHLESWLIEALARMVAEARTVASQVPPAIFRYFGESILALPPILDVAAEATSTWTMIDTQGYTIPAGTVVAWRTAGDELVPFEVVAAVTVPPGSLSTAADEVTLRAIDPGADANVLPAGAIELVDALAYVDSIVATAPAGGVDAETDGAYLDRLATELELLAPRPILPGDFAILARRVPGVHRALAIDNYNPVDQTTNNERMVAVAVVDENGAVLSQAVKDAVEAELESKREVNFVVNVIDPTYTVINVTFEVVAEAGTDLIEVEGSAVAAVTDYLDSGKWAGGDESPPQWRDDTVVRYLEVASVLDRVPGVKYVQSLLVNGGTVDVNLAGVAPLTQVGAINGTSY